MQYNSSFRTCSNNRSTLNYFIESRFERFFNTDNLTTIDFSQTFEEAVQKLVKVFNNTEAARTAFTMVRTLTQGDKPAEEFLNANMTALNRWNSSLNEFL